jgi:hypothetical protein
MAKYIEWIVYKGHKILLAKFTGITDEKEYMTAFDEMEKEVVQLPKGSRPLTLINVSNSVLSSTITERGKKFVAAKQAAGIPESPTIIVGVSGFAKAIVQAMQFFRKELQMADTMEEAKEWLIKQ